jgi:nitrous oxide reductase accessory protein NosL
MRRRDFLARSAAAALAPLGAGCAEADPAGGPERIRFDRDTCERCRMLISDYRFAAQARVDGARAAHKYDDIGCAVIHLKHLGRDAEASARIWVADLTSTGERVVWREARTARYLPGRSSPMGYDHAAVAPDTPGSVGYDDVRAAVFAKETRR